MHNIPKNVPMPAEPLKIASCVTNLNTIAFFRDIALADIGTFYRIVKNVLTLSRMMIGSRLAVNFYIDS
jgi:hypothetical protein